MKRSGLFFEFILLVFAFFLNCCEKDEEEDILPPVCDIKIPADSSEFQIGDTITINVEATDPDGLINAVLFYIDDVGKYSTKVLPYQFKWSTSNETAGFHIIRVTALDRGSNSSSDECIINLVVNLPVVITASVSSITNNSAVSGGNVTNDGGDTVTARGVCWSTLPDPTLDNAIVYTLESAGTGSYTCYLTGLSRARTYYVRAYATNSEGTSYGEQIIFITEPTSLAITTSPVTNINSASATCGGEITDDGGLEVTSRGVCWNTTGEPTISHNYTTNGTGSGSFASSITGLSSNTTYYVRAYVTNSKGTTYGNTVSFTTNAAFIEIKDFYTGLGWPDGIVVLDDNTLMVVQETHSTDGRGVLKCFRGDSYSEDDVFSGLGSPYNNPDGLIRLPDGRFIVTDGQAAKVFIIPAEGGNPEIFINGVSSYTNPALAPAGFDGPNVDPGNVIISEWHIPRIIAVNIETKVKKTLVDASFFTGFCNEGIGALEFGPDNKLYAVWSDYPGDKDPPRIYRFNSEGKGEIFLQLDNFDYKKSIGFNIEIDPVNKWLYYVYPVIQPSKYSGLGTIFRVSLTSRKNEFVVDLGIKCQNIELSHDGSSLFVGTGRGIKEVILNR